VQIGLTVGEDFLISAGDTAYVSASVQELRNAYSGALEAQLEAEVVTA
jgi:hypothetical protein